MIMETLFNLMLLFSLSYFTSPALGQFAYRSKSDTRKTLLGRPQGRVPPPLWQSQYSKQTEQPSLSNPQERVKTVDVKCHSGSMEIVVKADMFDLGFLIEGDELRLGVEEGDLCRATMSSADEYTIFVGLLDCGTKHWVTEDSLIYTNLLIYSPIATSDGVIRMNDAVIPIECNYGRKYSLTSETLQPTWIPFTSTVSAEETLVFDLKIMTSDWLYETGSRVYFLGDLINIEASVRVAHHMRLRIFIDSCVATLDPDRNSVPRYVFIDNDGCLVDSQLVGSNSQFMPRTQDDLLQFRIDAFRFHQEDRGELFITCHLTAVPITDDAEPNKKACSYIDGRWRSADGIDLLCGRCQRQNGVDPSAPRMQSGYDMSSYGQGKPRSTGFWKSGMKKGWEQDTSVGPMLVLQKQKSAPFAPRGRGGVPAFFTPRARIVSPGSLWKSGIDSKRGPLTSPSNKDLTEGLEQEAEDDLTGDAAVTVSTRRNLNATLPSSDKGEALDSSQKETLATTLPHVTSAPSGEGRNHTEELMPVLKSLNDTDTSANAKQNGPIKR